MTPVDISSIDVHNSYTQNPSQTCNNISENSNFYNSIQSIPLIIQ